MVNPRAHPTVTANSVIEASARHVSCVVQGQVVILHLDEGVYYSLNPVVATIWGLLNEPRELSQLVSAVVAEFDVDEAQCLQDITELVVSLHAHELVEVRGDDARA